MSERSSIPPARPRCAVIGVIGRTNSGKSTVVNRLVGEKVSIVSPVVQTTRTTIRGILTEGRGQLVFLDTPGLHRAEGHLGTLMNRMARQAAANVDVALLVIDGACKPQIEDDGWMRRLAPITEQPLLILLNKANRAPFYEDAYRALWESICREKAVARDVVWLIASAQTGRGLEAVTAALFACAEPADELLYADDVVTDHPRRLAIADVIREKLFAKLHDELPHEVAVRVDEIAEHGDDWRISATIYVNRPSQKGIVIGDKGRTIRYVRRAAEPEIGEMFGVRAELELWVKVEKNWAKNFFMLRQFGYLGDRA